MSNSGSLMISQVSLPTLAESIFSSESAYRNCYQLAECGHQFCLLCLHDNYRSLIEDQYRHKNLKCPQNGCTAMIKEAEIRAILDNEQVIEKLERFRRSTRVALDPNLMHCVRPNCEEVIDVRLFEDWDWITCPTCSIDICKKCRTTLEDGHQCSDGSFQLMAWVNGQPKSIVSNCPQCNSLTEKDSGCCIIHCIVCTYSYCWTCGTNSYKGWHSKHMEELCQFWDSTYSRDNETWLHVKLRCLFQRWPQTTTTLVMIF